jgi:hypothetical protein
VIDTKLTFLPRDKSSARRVERRLRVAGKTLKNFLASTPKHATKK